MTDACTGASSRSASTITSTLVSRCSPACSTSGSARTGPWATRSTDDRSRVDDDSDVEENE
jgi:hypothetical protein